MRQLGCVDAALSKASVVTQFWRCPKSKTDIYRHLRKHRGMTTTRAKQGAMNHQLVTTGLELSGYQISRHFGVVRGIVVRSRSIVGSIGAALQTLIGGNITLYTELCEQARADAYELMIRHAQQVGANALIGVRYDATEVAPGVTEVLCYGTAVYVVPIGKE